MKREDWQAAYEPIPAALHTRVSSTLSQLDKEEKVMKRTIIRTLALALCAALLLCCTALALVNSDILKYLSGYNAELNEDQQRLLQSDFEQKTIQLGDVQVTLKEILADGYVCAIALEYRAPEGAYLTNEMVRNVDGEWDMTRADFLKEHGAYYDLSEETCFLSQDGNAKEYTDSMHDWRRLAPNIIQEQIILSTENRDMSRLQILLSADFITAESPETDAHYNGVFTPNYTVDRTDERKLTFTLSAGTDRSGIAQLDIVFAKLCTVFSAQLENAGDAVYAIRVFDASGEELSRSILSSMISYCTDGTVAKSYDAMAETPDALSVQLFRLAEDGSEPVVERITLNLKK